MRTSTTEALPVDPVGEAVADGITDVLAADVELVYAPVDGPPAKVPPDRVTATATAPGPPGWEVTYVVRLKERVADLAAASRSSSIPELLAILPDAAVDAAAGLRHLQADTTRPIGPALRRALRDTVASEVLSRFLASRAGSPVESSVVADTVEYLIELSSTRIESHEVTHGVVVADVLQHTPRLEFRYPRDVRPAKRAPLLFDGQRSVLVVDSHGRARTEVQRHRLDHLPVRANPGKRHLDDTVESGSFVSELTERIGGLGFFLRADRSIWTFVDGQPLLVRRNEHWTAFPVELTASLRNMTDGAAAAGLVARAAFMISARPGGAILAIVDDPSDLDQVVSVKDRYDLRDDIDPAAMRPETRLHHLIDGDDLDERTLVRLATLDGATVLDREGRLLAYGAIVTSADSVYEGARTAAAKTLSNSALVALKVSADGDITIFRDGVAVTTLLGRLRDRRRRSRPT